MTLGDSLFPCGCSSNTCRGTDSYCFKCQGDGELVQCDGSTCTRSYHRGCVGKHATEIREDEPWYCSKPCKKRKR
jgi:hypothetical protein